MTGVGRSIAVPAFALACLLTAGSLGSEEPSRPGHSEWWPEVEKVEELLRAHKWKGAKKKAKDLAKTVMGKSWYGPDLGRVLTELALAQAIADANLGRDEEAIWYWHLATNLDFRVRTRDLAPYGRAGKLLYENKLRARGEMPVGFENREVTPLVRSTPPKVPDLKVIPTILNNTAAVRERSGDFHAEVIVDKEGRLHHPVVESTYIHPIVTYAVLEWMKDLPRFEPRKIEGEPTDSLYPFSVDFKYSRW